MTSNQKQSKVVNLTAVGFSSAIPIELKHFHHGVGIICTVNGSGSYNVQVTGDDPRLGFNFWNLHDLMNNLTASQNGNLAFPVTAVRLQVMGVNGSINMAVVQAGAF